MGTIAFNAFGEALPDPSPERAAWTFLELAGGWLIIVGLFGWGKKLLDRTSPALTYLAESSYPVYVLHQTVIVAIGFYLVQVAPWPALSWPLLIVLSAAVSFALYEGVRRVGWLRFLFGMKPLRASGASSH